MGIILAPISLILFILVFIVETVFSFFFRTKKRKWYRIVSAKMYRKAKLIDIFGNYIFPEFWQFLFSKRGENYSYGKLGETISSVFSKKRKDKSLTYFGLFIYYFLYLIDIPSWKYGGHCHRFEMDENEIKNFK